MKTAPQCELPGEIEEIRSGFHHLGRSGGEMENATSERRDMSRDAMCFTALL